MPRNGAGNYSLVSGNPVTTGTTISSTTHNNTLSDIATALSDSLAKDGQTAMTGNLRMAGNKVTGLGNATETGDALTFYQLFSQGQQQDIASAATTDIGAPLTTLLNVTGAATITSFGTNYHGPRFLRFAGVCTLTNSASLVLPGGANITTAAGDSAIAVPLGNPATGWRVAVYERADGTILSNAYALLSGATFTGNVNVPSLNGGQLAGMRNKIINGKMEIAQRGASFAAIANAAYSLDRWQWDQDAGAQSTVTHNSDVPSSNEFQNSLRVTVTTADTSIAAGDFAVLGQKIEGFNARDLIGRTFTLSFWVRSSKTGVHCVSLRNAGVNRSFIVEYSISAANTWEFKTVTVNGGLITAGTWDWANGVGVNLRFALATGPTFQTTAGAWQTGNFLATANQVNVLDAIDNIFAITGVQLEVGSVATPFEHRPIGVELALCQRYYQTLTQVGLRAAAVGGNSLSCLTALPVAMRAAGTVTATAGAGTGHLYEASASIVTFAAFPDAVGNIGATDVRIAIEL